MISEIQSAFSTDLKNWGELGSTTRAVGFLLGEAQLDLAHCEPAKAAQCLERAISRLADQRDALTKKTYAR